MSAAQSVNYARISAFLGEPYSLDAGLKQTHPYTPRPITYSDADLVLAVLEKLAREGRDPELQCHPTALKGTWEWHVVYWPDWGDKTEDNMIAGASGKTPISAISALVEALGESQ